MPKDNVIELKKPEPFVDDPITDILRQGARKLLAVGDGALGFWKALSKVYGHTPGGELGTEFIFPHNHLKTKTHNKQQRRRAGITKCVIDDLNAVGLCNG